MGKEYWTLSFSLELSDGGSTYKKDMNVTKHGAVVLQVLYMINLK